MLHLVKRETQIHAQPAVTFPSFTVCGEPSPPEGTPRKWTRFATCIGLVCSLGLVVCMSCVQANCRCDELQSRPQAQLTSCVQCLVRFSASGVYSLRATGLPNTNPRTSSLAVSRYGQLEWSAVKPYVLSDATVGDDASVLGHLWWRDEAASADAPYGLRSSTPSRRVFFPLIMHSRRSPSGQTFVVNRCYK